MGFILYKAREPLGVEACRVRGVESKRHNLCEYVGKIKSYPTLEQLKILVVGKASSWDSVLQRIGSLEDAA